MKEKKPKTLNVKKDDLRFYIQIGMIVTLIGILMFSIINPQTDSVGSGIGTVSASEIIPTGEPFYGKEMGFSYDDINPNDPRGADQAIKKFAILDQQIGLTGSDLDRYIDILYNQHNGMSCEYCCGARSIIFENGEPACGCAHSFAMRGLTKHLITNYSDLSDTEILEEVAKFKVLFFPGIHEQKADVMNAQGIETDYISLTTNEYRGIEQGQVSGGMVGGC
ncbi:MAG: hypothetical protein WDZ69_00775 [Candidatus Pacearchaeota archaeon]